MLSPEGHLLTGGTAWAVSIGGAHLCPGAQFRVGTAVAPFAGGDPTGADNSFLIWFYA